MSGSSGAVVQEWLTLSTLTQALPPGQEVLPQELEPWVYTPPPQFHTHLNHGLGGPGGDSAFQSLFSSSLNQIFQVSQILQMKSGTVKSLKLGQEAGRKKTHAAISHGSCGLGAGSYSIPVFHDHRRSRPSPGSPRPSLLRACPHHPATSGHPASLTLLLFSSSTFCRSRATAS